MRIFFISMAIIMMTFLVVYLRHSHLDFYMCYFILGVFFSALIFVLMHITEK